MGKFSNKILQVNIDELRENLNNARTHSESQIDKISASILKFGFVNPVLIDDEKNIIAGHGRVQGAKRAGLLEVPCVLVDYLTEDEKRAYVIADNKLAEEAGWDMDILSKELFDLKECGIDISAIGFEESEISQIEDLARAEVEEDDFDVELPTEPKAKRGDIYILGENRLMCGDSTNSADVEKLMDGKQADMLLTDPPYNIGYQGKTADKLSMQNDDMDSESFRDFLSKVFINASDNLKNGSAFYIWYSPREGFNVMSACDKAKLKVRQCIVWVKNSIVLGRQDYQWKHEPCLEGWKHDPCVYGWTDGAKHYFVDDRTQSTVIFEDKPLRNAEHPTMKPLKLLAHQIKNSSIVGDIVLDLFGGSGSTLIACSELNRKCYTMEIDPRYVDVIINRYEKATNEKAIKL